MGVAVSIDNVVKNFGSLRALDGVSLQVAEGEFFGLLGPNGAGKTTLISCLAGLVRPDAGRLTVMGGTFARTTVKRGVGSVWCRRNSFSTRSSRCAKLCAFSRATWTAQQRRLDRRDPGKPGPDEQGRREYAPAVGRDEAPVLVAQALVHKPPVIVFDEPTAGVDVELRQGLWQFVQRLNREGHTVILTTHYLEES